MLVLLPEIRRWAAVDEIESIQYDMTSDNWQEVGSAPKWDPRNRETADHSLPFLLARGLLDGDIYLDSFTQARLTDPKARQLMAKMTLGRSTAGAAPAPAGSRFARLRAKRNLGLGGSLTRSSRTTGAT